MKTVHLKHVLTPLLLSLAVSQAWAVEIIRTGVAGTPGAPGAIYPDWGETGGVGGAVWQNTVTSDAHSKLTLTGGQGGEGGAAGTSPSWPLEYGNQGGEGGQGGLVDATLDARRSAGPVTAELILVGGVGGNGGLDNFGVWSVRKGGIGGVVAGVASATTGAGNAHVRVRAAGGAGGPGADGSAASASGMASAANGVATGDVLVEGGAGGGAIYYAAIPTRTGDATAALQLDGGGAVGTSRAIGGASAISTARATTSGRALVDLTSLAQITEDGDARAELFVDSGYGSKAVGGAAVSGKAVASAAQGVIGTNTARVTLQGSGSISGTAEARGSDAYADDDCPLYYCRYTGSAESFASGVTRGGGNVSITSLALGGKPRRDSEQWESAPSGGSARAVASGQSGSGAVDVRAHARSYSSSNPDQTFVNPDVQASATTTAAGGSSYAEATHESLGPRGEYKALAEASSVGTGGARAVAKGINVRGGYGGTVESRATASGGGVTVSTHDRLYLPSAGGTATSAANVGGALYALPASDATNMVASHATGLPSSADTAALLADSPLLAATDARWIGAGGMGFSNVAFAMGMLSDVQYSFATSDGQHLLLGLFGAGGVSSDGVTLDFSVSNQGVPVFSGYFSGSALTALMSDRLIDLGGFGAGPQNLTIAARWYGSFGTPSAYGFQYLVGVTPVPESSTWLAMLLGLGTLLMVARRPSSFHFLKACQ